MNVPAESSGGVILPVAHALGQAPRLGGDRAEALRVGVEDGRDDERVLARDRDADVDARVELELAVAVGAVGAREVAQGERGGLDHEVVEGRRRPLAGGGLELAAQRDGLLHVDLERHHEVRRGRLGLGHPAGDRALQPVELGVLDLAAAAVLGGGLGAPPPRRSSLRLLGLLGARPSLARRPRCRTSRSARPGRSLRSPTARGPARAPSGGRSARPSRGRRRPPARAPPASGSSSASSRLLAPRPRPRRRSSSASSSSLGLLGSPSSAPLVLGRLGLVLLVAATPPPPSPIRAIVSPTAACRPPGPRSRASPTRRPRRSCWPCPSRSRRALRPWRPRRRRT